MSADTIFAIGFVLACAALALGTAVACYAGWALHPELGTVQRFLLASAAALGYIGFFIINYPSIRSLYT